jgi:hypothetical protein
VSTLEAEIKDLSNYLGGLPRELLASGAFSSYEARLNQLKTELAAARLRQLAGMVEQKGPASFVESVNVFLERAGTIERKVRREERRNLSLVLSLDVGVVLLTVASAGVFLLADGVMNDPISSMLALPGAVIVLALARLALEWPRRTQRGQVIADRIHLLRNELGRYERQPMSSDEAAELSHRVYLLLEDLPGSGAGSRRAA